MTPALEEIMGRSVIFVTIGGMIGSGCRFLASYFIVQLLPFVFQFGTFIVNILGCFAMGAAVGLAERYIWIHHDWRAFLTAGFCGGFTTFSAFAFENVELLVDKHYGTFAAYSAATFVLCLAATFTGLILTRN
jgi:fluoride exporter